MPCRAYLADDKPPQVRNAVAKTLILFEWLEEQDDKEKKGRKCGNKYPDQYGKYPACQTPQYRHYNSRLKMNCLLWRLLLLEQLAARFEFIEFH